MTTATRRARPGRKPAAIRRPEIADAAMRILASRGARSFTAKAVAAEIGVSDAALFRHFPSMQAIAGAVIERMESILFAGFPPREEDPVERLGVFFRARVRAIADHPHLSRLLFSEHLAEIAGAEGVAKVGEFKRRSRRFVAACLREAGRRKMLRDGLDPETGTVLVLGAILALAHTGARSRGSTGLHALSQGVWSALEFALRGAGRSPKPPGRTRK